MAELKERFTISKPIRFSVGWVDDDSVLALRFAIIDALQGRETTQRDSSENRLLCWGSVQRSADAVRVRTFILNDTGRRTLDNAWASTWKSCSHDFDIAVAVADAVSAYVNLVGAEKRSLK